MKKSNRKIILMLCLVFILGISMSIAVPRTASAASKVGKVGQVNTSSLNLRTKASTTASIKVKLSINDRVIIKAVKGKWYKVKAYNKGKAYYGYVHSDYITMCRTGKVTRSTLNLRAKASTKSKIKKKLSKGDKVYILEDNGSWYKVVAVHNKHYYLGYVVKKYIKASAVKKNGRVIYLTFDDGPYKYTDKLLKILDKYNVKVTFFVTNQYPDYQNMIKKEAEAGHAIAVHTYSHNYAKIYKSRSAYIADLDKMAAIIKKQTGKQPDILRFPGGSSNTISKSYCKGIMSDLTKYVGTYGYAYSDWNITSGDAGETTSTDQVVQNVINGIKGQGDKPSVVLQHDIKEFSVNAVERIIKWDLDNGYTFKKMTTSDGIVHHGVNN